MMDRYNKVSKEISVLKDMIFDAYRDLAADEREEIRRLLLDVDTILYLKDVDEAERSLG